MTVIPSEVEESLTISETSRDVSTSVNMTKRLFVSLRVYHDIPSRSAALNMAIDEALVENATEPLIRFYKWNHPALSFGYFGKFADVGDHAPQRELVRRWTGGGIVLHGSDLTYSIVIPATEPAFSESAMSIYEKIHNALRAALVANGQRAELAASGVSKISDSCFANPGRADVMLNGHKVAGAAQRRIRRGLLQQGSVQDVDLGEDFEKSFASRLSDNCLEQTIDNQTLFRAQEIADQKYATPGWLRRR